VNVRRARPLYIEPTASTMCNLSEGDLKKIGVEPGFWICPLGGLFMARRSLIEMCCLRN